jgi:hypothetical protein
MAPSHPPAAELSGHREWQTVATNNPLSDSKSVVQITELPRSGLVQRPLSVDAYSAIEADQRRGSQRGSLW